MALPPEMEREQQVLAELHASPDPAAHAEASQLRSLYHTRQMALLAADAYDAAKNEGHAPPGWHRFTDDPERLREFAPRLTARDFHRVAGELRPDQSGFRAEIYIPDRSLQALGYKPVVAAKGSGGKIMTAHGLRDTTAEDFLGNNLPQAIGMETDYYDRYMRLSMDLANGHFDFEFSGHSLAASEAIAGAAITGMPATTFNAAALNPETPRRFAEQHGYLKLYDTAHRVNAIETQGDLLTQGVQGTLHDMGAARRAELANVLQETSRLITGNPEGRALLEREFANMPPAARQTATAFVARLADGDVDQMLRDLPQTQGQVHTLPAMMVKDGRLVPRPADVPLSAIMADTGPVWETLDAAAYGARVGASLGAPARAAGEAADGLLNAAGNAACAAGTAAGDALRDLGQRAAQGLDTAAAAQPALPPGTIATAGLDAMPWVERGMAKVERWVGDRERDALAATACAAGEALQAAGHATKDAGHKTGNAGTAAGAMAAADLAISAELVAGLAPGPVGHAMSNRDAQAVAALARARGSAAEALERHSMRDTVIPSIDAKIGRVERRAQETLRYDATLIAARRPLQAGDDPAARASVHAVFKGLTTASMRHDVEGMRSIEQAQMHSPLMQQRAVQGQAWLAQQQAQMQQQPARQHQGPSLHH